MFKWKEKICRLCLKLLDVDYNAIEETIRKNFEVLLLKVDLSVSEEPVICRSCMESIQEAFDFKSTCIAVDKRVASLAIERNSAELDIRDIYLNENENKGLVFNEDYNVCRLCLQCLEKSNFNLLRDLRKNSAGEMLLECIPELDLNIIKEPVVCTACTKSLESYYSFAMKCRNTEENIMKYCEEQQTECVGQINLSNVLKFLLKGRPECFGNCSKTMAIKEENKEDTKSEINNIVLEREKDEPINTDDTSYADYKTEENWCGEIKQEELVEDEILTHKDSSENHKLVRKDSPETAIYKCNLCSYEAKRKNYLKNHMLTHMDSSDVQMFRCSSCTFETKRKLALRRHMLVHKDSSEIVMYRCEECPYETKYKKGLKRHMLIHKDNSEVTMYKCNLCTYETKRKSNLSVHMLSHKNSSEVVMYRCERCTYETKYRHIIREHILVHKDNSEVTTYKCNLCSYEGKKKRYLRVHMLTHKGSSNAEILKCALCTFESKYRRSLKKHMLIHKKSSELTTKVRSDDMQI